jgi:hypothetical protein
MSRNPKKISRIEALDLDNDPNTPNNVLTYDRNGNIYSVDGYYTKDGFGGVDSKGNKILRNRDLT